MTPEPTSELRQQPLRRFFGRLGQVLMSNWKLKLVSILVAITIWGALISEDASLLREKTFHDVPVSITGMDALQRNGLVIVGGLDAAHTIQMRADVPQKAYSAVNPSNYSVRADVSRITETGEQKVPIQTLSTASFGSVTWLSSSEITVVVDEYITRRRVPVKLVQTGQLPEGYYATGISADPANVVISGPRSLVSSISTIVASYNQSNLDTVSGVQYSAVPYRLLDQQGQEITSKLISVTSENVLLDTILVEQTIYPTKQVDLNLTGLTKGQVAQGYAIHGIKADPASVKIAGPLHDIDGIKLLDLTSSIDVTDLNEPIIRAMRIEKPVGVIYMSESAVYVTVEIGPALSDQGD